MTGAASGIGRATALRFVADGYAVAALDRDREGLDKLVHDDPSAIVPWHVDLSTLETIEPFAEGLVARSGTPEVLVNAAGVGLVATAVEADLDAWQRVLAINLTAPMLLCRAFIPHMIKAGGGSIVNVASVAAFRGVRSRAAYCSAKAGLVGLTRSITADFAKVGIRANAVCPGTVRTGYTDAVLSVSEDPEATEAFMTQRQLIGRMGTPEEVADAIAFLAGPQATFFHGAAVVIDGGRSVM
ncbi:SDR family oxidoreductase [Amycolatopsis sp. K13G38]|uniref:SDR family oxidoreductase n=1 Tax=Amycolatopsis acididurans TaxID=2724524 RepID=A0ABX1JCZ0_9PSEU|nr:SDR family oxidoreductase [Amycolatopsis acididurans]NKQ56137.1 SDR family oxidoreductase [Amycolatopsis acididurans]